MFDNIYMVFRGVVRGVVQHSARWSFECGRKIPAWALALGVLPPIIPTFLEKSDGKRKKQGCPATRTYIYILEKELYIYVGIWGGGRLKAAWIQAVRVVQGLWTTAQNGGLAKV